MLNEIHAKDYIGLKWCSQPFYQSIARFGFPLNIAHLKLIIEHLPTACFISLNAIKK